MSVANKCKTARGRANEAIRQLKTRKELMRSFDDCFENNDGDDVLVLVVAHAAGHPDFADVLRKRGYGYWLEPDYYTRHGMSAIHPFAEKAGIKVPTDLSERSSVDPTAAISGK